MRILGWLAIAGALSLSVAAVAQIPSWSKNALLEPRVIEALADASQAGVELDMIGRGGCALRPGGVGGSGSVRVRSSSPSHCSRFRESKSDVTSIETSKPAPG